MGTELTGIKPRNNLSQNLQASLHIHSKCCQAQAKKENKLFYEIIIVRRCCTNLNSLELQDSYSQPSHASHAGVPRAWGHDKRLCQHAEQREYGRVAEGEPVLHKVDVWRGLNRKKRPALAAFGQIKDNRE